MIKPTEKDCYKICWQLKWIFCVTESEIQSIGLCVGSGITILQGLKVDVLVTGEMKHSEALDCLENDQTVILCGHADSERHYLPTLAETLKIITQCPNIHVSKADQRLFNFVWKKIKLICRSYHSMDHNANKIKRLRIKRLGKKRRRCGSKSCGNSFPLRWLIAPVAVNGVEVVAPPPLHKIVTLTSDESVVKLSRHYRVFVRC